MLALTEAKTLNQTDHKASGGNMNLPKYVTNMPHQHALILVGS